MNSKIVIIGAGASGIAAGSKLVTAGFTNLTILEAESRIGGRIDTNAFGRGCIDLGAQWCTGTVGNVVYEMAEAHGLIGPGQWRPANIQYVRSDGTIVDREILDPLFKLITLLEISDEEANDERNNGRSVGELISSRYANAIKAKEYGFVDAELAVQFLQYLQTNVNGSMASDSWFEGSQLLTWKGRGFNTVIDLLLNKIPDSSKAIQLESRIRSGKTVCNILWSNESSARSMSYPQSRIECSDGSYYAADHVIWTGSLGVLREHHATLFTPALPALKVDAIREHKMGTLAKMFLESAVPFWTADLAGMWLWWRSRDLQHFRSTFGDEWMADVAGFFPVDFQTNVLCGWLRDKSARQMAKLPELQVQTSLMRLLRMFLLHSGLNIHDPIAFRRSLWNMDASFLGSYSYQTTLADQLNVSRVELAAPLLGRGDDNRPLVQFAGEMTVCDHYGIVHGAIKSGWREADRLIELYSQDVRFK